ncbi:MAG: efflux RND transporter periplasmic adaptor subunit [Candidatus Obscuribacterales bacterium]|nr:efflux RND transporter periplasmic adaptor subunit [Candidatus Obscuribacterales bacterium]
MKNMQPDSSTANHGPNRTARCKSGNTMIFLLVLAVIIGVLFAVGLVPKMQDKQLLDIKEKQAESAVPVVRTVKAKVAPFEETALFPGNIGAMQYATIYARVDGYLKSRMVDIGDRVKAGQILAEIDTPTLDEEIAQAEADLKQAKAALHSAQANLKETSAQADAAAAEVRKAQADQSYASVTADRWVNMAERGAVSLQSRDEKNRALGAQNASLEAARAQKVAADQATAASAAQVEVSRAAVEAKLAGLNKYKAQQNFKYVVAPFTGVITSRKVDPGALITAGSQSTSLELFQMAKLDVLRIYVSVPQDISRYLKPGQKAELVVTAFPERRFEGTITNIAGALDPQTRTRQTETKVPNPDHVLLPGMYADVRLSVHRDDTWVKVPSDAVLPRGGGLQVVVVKDGKAHFQDVVPGRDFGDEMEIKSGLNNDDTVVVSPPDDLREGDPVKSSDPAAQ